jgi:hypothetical protein
MTAIVKIEKTPRKKQLDFCNTENRAENWIHLMFCSVFCYCAEFSALLDCLSSFKGKCLPLPSHRTVHNLPVNEEDSI